MAQPRSPPDITCFAAIVFVSYTQLSDESQVRRTWRGRGAGEPRGGGTAGARGAAGREGRGAVGGDGAGAGGGRAASAGRGGRGGAAARAARGGGRRAGRGGRGAGRARTSIMRKSSPVHASRRHALPKRPARSSWPSIARRRSSRFPRLMYTTSARGTAAAFFALPPAPAFFALSAASSAGRMPLRVCASADSCFGSSAARVGVSDFACRCSSASDAAAAAARARSSTAFAS